ncbi:MAG TPA: sorbosone dehydrogenase family protein [Steroidobacteraceae bacterium]|nr:sorbosone dehydrogenase family protein [Steroidobacteraceae bacterium]
MRHSAVFSSCLLLAAAGCATEAELPVSAGTGTDPKLPPPPELNWIPTIDIAPAIGWPEGATPQAAPGFAVNAFATGFDHPRWLYVLPNGDVLVAETNAQPAEGDKGLKQWFMAQVMEEAGAAVPSADRITLLRDADGDGVAEFRSVLLEDLTSPFGMELVGDVLYIANTDALLAFPYEAGQTRITAEGRKVADLPASPPNYHWTKNVVASPDGSRLYVTVGSNSNIAENGLDKEQHRAAILEVDPRTGQWQEFATGLRNPVGLDFHPGTGEMWTSVNERDGLGGDLVPDYMTSVERGEFFGWPFSYFGQHVDERVEPQREDLVASAVVPDYALGPHTSSLGLTFYEGELLPRRFHHGAFVGQHGSWNRSPLSGYKVIFVPFENGRPHGDPVDILTGFVSEQGDAFGRPVGVTVDREGALLVADDVGNVIWRVVPQ